MRGGAGNGGQGGIPWDPQSGRSTSYPRRRRKSRCRWSGSWRRVCWQKAELSITETGTTVFLLITDRIRATRPDYPAPLDKMAELV